MNFGLLKKIKLKLFKKFEDFKIKFKRLKKFEDFYAVNEEEGLVVSGYDYVHLTAITRVSYKLFGNKVLLKYISNEIKGKYLRLGNFFNNKFVYSDGDTVFLSPTGINPLNPIAMYSGIQPYLFEDGIVYQNKGVICLNDDIIIKPWDEYVMVGRPTVYKRWVYFETRSGPAPLTWETWKYHIDEKKFEQVLTNAANAFVCYNKLFYSSWDKEVGAFITCVTEKL